MHELFTRIDSNLIVSIFHEHDSLLFLICETVNERDTLPISMIMTACCHNDLRFVTVSNLGFCFPLNDFQRQVFITYFLSH